MGNRFPDADQEVQVRDIRQPQIHDHHIEPVVARHGHGLAAVGGSEDVALVVGQFFLQQPSDRFFVIDDQDGIFFSVHAYSLPGSVTRNADPLPTVLVTLISPWWFLTME